MTPNLLLTVIGALTIFILALVGLVTVVIGVVSHYKLWD